MPPTLDPYPPEELTEGTRLGNQEEPRENEEEETDQLLTEEVDDLPFDDDTNEAFLKTDILLDADADDEIVIAGDDGGVRS